jgi:protein TonB
MSYDFYNEKNDFFSVIAASFVFHAILVIAFILIAWLGPAKEPPPPIPFFELVNVMPPPPAPPAQAAKPQPSPPKQEPVPETKPEVKPELKPEIKPEVKKTEAKPETKPRPHSEPEPVTESEPEKESAKMDMPMDLPKDIKKPEMDMPALRALGNIAMDPQMQAYLAMLLRLIYQNFNPASGTEIAKGTKSSVAFKIERNGEVSEVVLRSSSGNAIWDRLAVRAVQITKPPPLPPSYTGDDLPLIFDFKEK